MSIFSKRSSSWRNVDFAAVVPEQLLDSEASGDPETISVLLPRYTGPIWGRLLQPRLSEEKRYIRVPLEERGAFLWKHIDGRRCIADLVPLFCLAFPDDEEQAAERISTYLYHMSENGFIRLIRPEEASAD